MTQYRLFPATNGPAAVAAASGGWLLGVMFSVTGGVKWLNGYYHWVPNNGDATPRKFALWTISSTTTQSVIANSTVTSGTMTLGAWNFVPLPSPIQLAPSVLYCAAVGWTVTTGIPVTSGQFGAAEPFAAGIVNGPLTAWSALAGSNKFPGASLNYGHGQMMFSNVLGADPAAAMPNNGSGDDNLWVDVQVDDTAPAGYSGTYRLYPGKVDLGNFSLDTANGFTLGLEFSLTQQVTLSKGWFYSPAGVAVLPTEVGVYRVSDKTLVAHNAAASWSGAAASGWISTTLTGTLDAGTNYKYVVFQGANSIWNAAVANWWTGSGFGGSGLTTGPATMPNSAGADVSQNSYHQAGVISYPDTTAGPFEYGLDFEFTPLAASGGGGGPGRHHREGYW